MGAGEGGEGALEAIKENSPQSMKGDVAKVQRPGEGDPDSKPGLTTSTCISFRFSSVERSE